MAPSQTCGEPTLDSYFAENVGPGDAVIGVILGAPMLAARFGGHWPRLMRMFRTLDLSEA